MPAISLCLVFATALGAVVVRPKMFVGRHGKRHRQVGAVYLFWLTAGVIQTCYETWGQGQVETHILYDAVLGLLGVLLAWTASRDFSTPAHTVVSNKASGTLEDTATVTVSEMQEHTFFQGIHLTQALYLHIVPHMSPIFRLVVLMLACTPWLVRHRYPYNSFSKNYAASSGALTWIGLLYRMKKYQFLFYKHVLLHGLNIAQAGASVGSAAPVLVDRLPWRWYWISINTAYVMEFFLQTLVKRGDVSQSTMLRANQVLMIGSSVAVVHLLLQGELSLLIAAVSLALNFAHRKHDFTNTALIALTFLVVHGSA